ncbi:MAG: type II toxin-antitoxin system VapC family toxin [Chlorobium sp.]|nr:MAG: type II toxin-antitoxin system VapC family toxin [Chlorobium sp.]
MLFLDSNVLIYLIEGEASLVSRIRQTIQKHLISCPDLIIAISALTLLECRVAPLRDNNTSI